MIMSVSCGYVKWIMALEQFMVFSISMLRCWFGWLHRIESDWINLSKRIIYYRFEPAPSWLSSDIFISKITNNKNEIKLSFTLADTASIIPIICISYIIICAKRWKLRWSFNVSNIFILVGQKSTSIIIYTDYYLCVNPISVVITIFDAVPRSKILVNTLILVDWPFLFFWC